MNFFLDENFPKESIKLLDSKKNEIFEIRGTAKEGLQDFEIFTLAKEKKAIFLTTDKDFFHTIHFTEKPHSGIIVINISQPKSREIIKKLEWALEFLKDKTIENKCLLIKDNSCRIFS